MLWAPGAPARPFIQSSLRTPVLRRAVAPLEFLGPTKAPVIPSRVFHGDLTFDLRAAARDDLQTLSIGPFDRHHAGTRRPLHNGHQLCGESKILVN